MNRTKKRSVNRTKAFKKTRPRSKNKPDAKNAAPRKPLRAQIEERFSEIEEKEGLFNPADGTRIRGGNKDYRGLADEGDIEGGDLEDPEAPEDTVSTMRRAEEEDTLASGELELPGFTEDQAHGDGEEDSDDPYSEERSET